MKAIITEDGMIQAIGWAHPFELPELINQSNFQSYRCIDLNDTANPDSWEPVVTFEQKRQQLDSDKQTGSEIIDRYVIELRDLELTLEQSLMQLEKFRGVKALLEIGNLSGARKLMSAMQVDEIFTEERKQKYISYL